MDAIVNELLLSGDKFMPEMHFKQPGCTYSACGPFTKNKERIEKIKETGDSRYIYENELDKACIQLDMSFGDFKDLNRRTIADKVLRDKAFNIAKNPKYHKYQRSFTSMVYKFSDKKPSWGKVKDKIISIEEVAEELHKQIIGKLNKRKVHSSFIDNIWGAGQVDMQLISKFSKQFRFLLCVIDIYSKCARVIPFKDKKEITITNAFQKILNVSKRKPSKIWVGKCSEFCNRSMKSWIQNNDIKIYSTHSEKKFALAERFIRTLKSKIHKNITLISKNLSIDRLDYIVNKYHTNHIITIQVIAQLK